MTKASIIVFMVINIICPDVFGQYHLPYDSLTQKITYKDVLKTDSLKAGAIFELAQKWVQVKANGDIKKDEHKFTIQRVDADSNKIVAIGRLTAQYDDYQSRPLLTVYYTLTIEAKNGRSRIKITELQHDGLSTVRNKPKLYSFEETYFGSGDKSRIVKNAWLAFFTDCDKQLREIIDDYKKFVTQPPVVKLVSDDW